MGERHSIRTLKQLDRELSLHKRGLAALSRLLRIRDDQAEDALYNERAAQSALRQQLSRRGFMGLGAALTAGTAFGFYNKLDHLPWYDPKNLYVSLHTKDDPYSSYGLVAVERSPKGWRVEGNEAHAVDRLLTFPAATAGDLTVDAVTIYSADGVRRFSGELKPPIRIVDGVTPQLIGLACQLQGDLSTATFRHEGA